MYAHDDPYSALELADEVKAVHNRVEIVMLQIRPEDFDRSPDSGWSAAKNLAHLTTVQRIIDLSFALPSFIPKLIFGTADRPPKKFSEFKDNYLNSLAQGADAGLFKPVDFDFITGKQRRKQMLRDWYLVGNSMAYHITECDPVFLDRQLLPHPTQGNIIAREIIYSAILHTTHHLNKVIEKYNLNK